MPTAFGPFEPLFDSGDYLELLNLGSGADRAIDRVAVALQAPAAIESFDTLMSDGGWRPHLVGAMACLLDRAGQLDRRQLWNAADGGSWVGPQLVVAALLSDPEFEVRARQRLDNREPLQRSLTAATPAPVTPAVAGVRSALAGFVSRLFGRPTREVTSLIRHVVDGPGTDTMRSAKLVASILAVCHRVPALAAAESAWRDAPEIKHLLAQDVDHSDKIALGWLKAVEALLLKRGVSSSHPTA